MLDTTVSDHRQIDAWGGYTEYGSRFGVRCQCGLAFDGFDTVADATALLDRHIATETAPDPWTEAANALRQIADVLDAVAALELPGVPAISVGVQPSSGTAQTDAETRLFVDTLLDAVGGRATTEQMSGGTYMHRATEGTKVGPVNFRVSGTVGAPEAEPEPLTVHLLGVGEGVTTCGIGAALLPAGETTDDAGAVTCGTCLRTIAEAAPDLTVHRIAFAGDRVTACGALVSQLDEATETATVDLTAVTHEPCLVATVVDALPAQPITMPERPENLLTRVLGAAFPDAALAYEMRVMLRRLGRIVPDNMADHVLQTEAARALLVALGVEAVREHDCALNLVEVRMSGCRFGCKIHRCTVCNGEQEIHNYSYGCLGGAS